MHSFKFVFIKQRRNDAVAVVAAFKLASFRCRWSFAHFFCSCRCCCCFFLARLSLSLRLLCWCYALLQHIQLLLCWLLGMNRYHLMCYHFVVSMMIRLHQHRTLAHAQMLSFNVSICLFVCLFIYLLCVYEFVCACENVSVCAWSPSSTLHSCTLFTLSAMICISAQAHFVSNSTLAITRTTHSLTCHFLFSCTVLLLFCVVICLYVYTFNYVEHQLTLILNWPLSTILPFIFPQLICNSFCNTWQAFSLLCTANVI